jgi:hypothetical protein
MPKPKKGAKPKASSKAPSHVTGKPATVRERARAVDEEPLHASLLESPRGRRPVNLTLDRDAVERGERFAARHGVSVSMLVSGFLQALPEDESVAPSAFVPAVQRLYGLAAGHEFSRDTYREFLASKYGVK